YSEAKAMIKTLVAILLLVPLCAVAQRQKRDPLSDLEVDKLRDAAQTPDVRLKLYIEFARTRLERLQQAKADMKAADRDQQMQDALQDFIDIFDELDDNVDTFADRDDDLRKALKPVIEADTEFGSKLRGKNLPSTITWLAQRCRPWTTGPKTTAACWQSRKRSSRTRKKKLTRKEAAVASSGVWPARLANILR